jgi:hypothetical protein
MYNSIDIKIPRGNVAQSKDWKPGWLKGKDMQSSGALLSFAFPLLSALYCLGCCLLNGQSSCSLNGSPASPEDFAKHSKSA